MSEQFLNLFGMLPLHEPDCSVRESYVVEQDREAYERMLRLTGGNRTVPVIVEECKLVRVGEGYFIQLSLPQFL
jgi:hypothetical protein